jgi:hypothetical protein
MSKSGQFERKTIYSKKNEKLWTLLDNMKNQIDNEKLLQKKLEDQEKSKKFLDGIK